MAEHQTIPTCDDPLHGKFALWSKDEVWGNDSELISYAQVLEDFTTELEEDGCPETSLGRVIQFHDGKYDDITDSVIEQAREAIEIAAYEHKHGKG